MLPTITKYIDVFIAAQKQERQHQQHWDQWWKQQGLGSVHGECYSGSAKHVSTSSSSCSLGVPFCTTDGTFSMERAIAVFGRLFHNFLPPIQAVSHSQLVNNMNT
mmetsp:Transcript_5892/g.10951  ORF Transcript_5892/g.10951 Transcript_5892/m.10951 type:complete len:105 (+) Transcript_5892:851-1165(+)